MMMTDVGSHATSASLYKSLPYDPQKGVEPIPLPGRSPLVLVVAARLGVKSIPQLIDLAKTRAGHLSYASSGPGAITHLSAERFKREARVELLHVPYRGGAPATAAMVAGESDMGFVCISAAPLTQAQFKQYVLKEMREWGEVVRGAGLKAE